MKRSFSLILCTMLTLAGCGARVKTVTNLPPGVTQQQAQNYDAAVADLQKLSAATSTLRQSVIALNKAGTFPDGPAYVATLQAIGKVDQFQITAANFLKTVTPATYDSSAKAKLAGYINQISLAVEQLNAAGTTGIKNQQSLQQINTLIAELAALAGLVLG